MTLDGDFLRKQEIPPPLPNHCTWFGKGGNFLTIQKRQRPSYGAYFFAACEALFREPLFCHADASGDVRLLIWSDDAVALREGLVVAASCGCMPDVRVEIALCGATAQALKAVLHSEAPMFDEIFSRRDTADIRFDASPAGFPPYVLCTEDKRPFVPAGVHCAVLRPSEISGELLRLAENLHYTFMVSYGSRDALADILRSMHADKYNYASSVLQAAHLPVKLWCAGAYGGDCEAAAMRYAERIAADRGLMNHLVSLEHTRWSVFMALSGWRIPSFQEMERYAFVEQADGSMIASFRHEEGLLHPALAACSPEGVDALEGAEGETYWNGADASQLDPLSRMSLWQHRHILGIAEAQRARARALLEEARAQSVGEVPELNRLVGVLNRLPSSAMELEKALVQMEGRIDSALLARLRRLLRSSIEAAKHRSYLQGDVFSVRTIGFVLLFRSRFTRMIRVLSPSADDNIGALMQLDPERAAFITGIARMSDSEEAERRGGVETFVQIRNLRTQLRYFDAAELGLEGALAQALQWAGADAIFDLTGATMDFIAASTEHRAFYLKNGRMLPSPFGAPFAIGALSTLPRELRVQDVFAALNRRAFVGWELPEIGDIGRVIEPAFGAFLSLTEDEKPDSNSRYKALFEQINRQFAYESYQKRGEAEAEHAIELPPEIAIKRNVTGCLRRLQDAGLIRALRMEILDGPGSYRYTFRSPDWVSCSRKGVRMLDYLKDDRRNDYVCSVRYRKAQKNGAEGLTPQMKLVWDEFEMPEGMSEALAAFDSCFERCENGRWRFASATAKGLFAAEGNLLEDYVWYQVHRNPHYRDVQLSFQFGLASGNDRLEQEIDVIAITTRNRPVLFSCKLGAKGLEADSGKEIASHSRIYAVNNPIPVLVTSCPEAIAAQKGFGPGGSERSYLKRRGVCFVDRAVLRDEQRFQQLLNEIASR